MTMTRKQRLKKLVASTAAEELHEMRRAGHLAAAAAAENDAAELRQRFDAPGSPGAVSRNLPSSHRSGVVSAAKNRVARDEAGRIATATARSNVVERPIAPSADRMSATARTAIGST
jgi:hypothetical protein